MKLSAFSVVDAFPAGTAAHRDRYAELLTLAELSEHAGLETLWVAEHHFHNGGVCPAPPVLLAAAGARTRRLRLGVLVGVLPFHSAVGLAEEYALLDRVIGGRLNLGLGSGYIPLEFEGFGIDPQEKRERFDRSLAVVLEAWAGHEVRVDNGRSKPVKLNVLPRQQPHPPLWIAVQRREAIPYVARRGMNVALVPYATLKEFAELRAEISEFRAALPLGIRATVSVAVPLYTGESVREARSAFQAYLEGRLATQSTFYTQKVHADARQASADVIAESGFALLDRPDRVEEGLRRLSEAGVDEVLGIFDFGGLAPELVRRSVEQTAHLSVFAGEGRKPS